MDEARPPESLSTKDFADLERMLATQRGKLHTAYARAQLAQITGANDERVKKWEQLVAEFGA